MPQFVAERRDRSVKARLWLGALFGPLALVAVALRLWSVEDIVALVDAQGAARKPMDLGELVIN